MSIESVTPSSHLILCHPLLLLPSISPSIRVFSNESALRVRWPKYWIFSFSISPSNEHPGLICFRRDWLDLLAVQGTLKSHLQHSSLKASVLGRSAFFMIRLSHPHMTTGEARARTRRTFVGKVMSLLRCQVCRKAVCIRRSLQGRFKPPHQLLPRVLGHGVLSRPFPGQWVLGDAGKTMMMCPSPRLFGLKRCTQPVLSLISPGLGGG